MHIGLIEGIFLILVVTVLLLGITTNYRTSLKIYVVQVFVILCVFYFLYQQQLGEDIFLLVSFVTAIVIRFSLIPLILKNFINKNLKRMNAKIFFFGRIYHLLLLFIVIIGTYFLSLRLFGIINFLFMGAVLMIFSGLINFINHKKIIGDILSFLEIENGVFLLSLLVITKVPFYLEFGIIIDIIMSILILSISLVKINKVYGEIDVEIGNLNQLKEK